MPNYVINNIYLDGPREDIDKLIALLGKNSEDSERNIDFNNVVKMPESMNLIAGNIAGNYIAAYLKTLSDKEKVRIAEKLQNTPARYKGNYLNKYSDAFIKTLTEKDKEYLISEFTGDFKRLNLSSIESVGKTYIDNIINYGADTWYDWSINNWGCKWNPSHYQFENNTISFNTANSASLRITKKLSEMFPSLSFSHEYADEDIGSNCGKVEFKKGDMVSAYFPEGDDAVRFACAMWDYDVSNYGLLPEGVEKMTLEEVIEPYNLDLKVEGNTIVLIDNGKPGSSYDGARFDINEKVISNILEMIESLTDEAYDEFCDDLSKKGIDPKSHGLEGLLVIAPTDTVNYGLMYNICYGDDVMTIEALEKRGKEDIKLNLTSLDDIEAFLSENDVLVGKVSETKWHLEWETSCVSLAEVKLDVIEFDGTVAGFVKAYRDYALNFDVDEYVSNWLTSGVAGLPSATELVENGNNIRDFYEEISTKLLRAEIKEKSFEQRLSEATMRSNDVDTAEKSKDTTEKGLGD